MSGWTDGQVREFARDFAARYRPLWPALVDDVREAMIDSYVLSVVLGQHDEGGVPTAQICSMRSRLAVQLETRWKMSNPGADNEPGQRADPDPRKP